MTARNSGVDARGPRLPEHRPQGMSRSTYDRLRPHWHLIGQTSDVTLSRTSGVSRLTIWELRHRLKIPTYRPSPPTIPAALRDDVRRRILAREKLTDIARDAGITWTVLRAFATEVGYDPEWKKLHMKKPSLMVGRIPKAEALRRFDAGETLDAIATRSGVSRERIRQIANKCGRQPRHIARHQAALLRRARLNAVRQRQRALRIVSKKRTAERRAKTTARYLKKARKLWQRGDLIRAIAKVYGLQPNSMAWWIFIGRKQFGWFPRRRR